MPIVKEALDDIENEAKEIIKESPGFIKHVFDFNNDNKCQILNIIQYAVLAIIPAIVILKITKNIIPEEDDTKGNLEILAEIVGQLVIMLMLIWFSNKAITYIPTYSGVNYGTFNLIPVILSWLVALFTMQTKIGHKINILVTRANLAWEGNASPAPASSAVDNVKIIQPFANQYSGGHQTSRADTLGYSSAMSTAMLEPTPNQNFVTSSGIPDVPNFNAMYQNDVTPLQKAATPEAQGPMAANEAMGGMFNNY